MFHNLLNVVGLMDAKQRRKDQKTSQMKQEIQRLKRPKSR